MLKVTNKADQQLGLNKRRPPVVQQQQQEARPPVIIYVESPKVVHAHPGEFKSVVQRLTGAPPPASALPPPLQFPFQLYGQLPSLVAASSLSPTTVAAPPPASSLPADAAASVLRSLGFFSNDQLRISPAASFLYDPQPQSMVAVAAPDVGAPVQAANPFLLPSSSIGVCYRHGDLFVNQR
ncbi:hypothetical protein BAE44_0005462 [Dichanthelium oligosanthes]|uniref:VQ domain-containing protein n=1 Tax=Dichanthelium oligosanthes TaxID=888268 RepID=A0A1E5W823_9POAL|nr:hypothetical protein BAE44_0005462 [Dichanthelium oligosanthes]